MRTNDTRFTDIDTVLDELQDGCNQKQAVEKLFNIMAPLIEIAREQQQEIKDLRKMINHIEPASRYEWWQKQIGIKPEGDK